MEEALSKHLDGVCRRMGGFLRGFEDPRIHLSPVSGFVADFRKIMTLPAVHQPGDKQVISYAAAVVAYRVLPVEPEGEAEDPVSTMLQGLAEPSLLCPDLRRKLPLEMLREDMVALLRTPSLHYHVTVSDRDRFPSLLEEIARAEGFPVVQQAFEQNENRNCPFCRSPLSPCQAGQVLKCGSCLQPLECVRWLPMEPAVTASVSFELLRCIFSLPIVANYRQEGKIAG